MNALLVAESIRKSFGRTTVLSSGHLEARSGCVTLVVGRNGAGKSTLLRIAAGLLRPDAGSVRFAQRTFSPPRLAAMAGRGLFFLPDRGILSPGFTLGRHLDVVSLRAGGRPPAEVARILGISHLLDRRPGGLSTGERRRAEVALAVARDPRCLIADEPLRGIDPKDVEGLLAVFRGLAARGCAVVVSGHHLQSLMEIADDLIWVRDGRSTSLGAPAQARLDGRFRREYLEGLPSAEGGPGRAAPAPGTSPPPRQSGDPFEDR
jgi:ABC-type multidrug transport system ATPase subunit